MGETWWEFGCEFRWFYIELNWVRAGLTGRAEDWPWSSVQAHLSGRDDDLVSVVPMLEKIADWNADLRSGLRESGRKALRHPGVPGGRTGWSWGL